MNIDINNYNYYGRVKSNYTYNTSVYDIQRRIMIRDATRFKTFKKILNKCYRKIRLSSDNNKKCCFYQLPEYIPGAPIYNMTECVLYLIGKLKKDGFDSIYISAHILYISWFSVTNKKYELIHDTNKSLKSMKSIKDNLKHKLTEDYKPTGNYLYK